MKIVERNRHHKHPRTRALVYCPPVYYGWTGFEEFGCIWPFRYFGWRVTCWAAVAARVYGDARPERFFTRFAHAVKELDRLMDRAEKMGQLAHEPVQYADIKLLRPRSRPVQLACAVGLDLISAHPPRVGDRMPRSPAYYLHLQRFFRIGPDPDLPARLGIEAYYRDGRRT